MTEAAERQALLDQAQKEYNSTKQQAFRGKDAAFLGALLCNMRTEWRWDLPTAATDGNIIYWNPAFFLSLPRQTRVTVLMHELWHVGLLHIPRLGTKDPEKWNFACDYAINIMLADNGYTFEGTQPLLDPKYRGLHADEIYKRLPNDPTGGGRTSPDAWGNPDGKGDMQKPGAKGDGSSPGSGKPSAADISSSVRKVAAAVEAVSAMNRAMGKEAGNLPGNIVENLDELLRPIIKWETVTEDFLTERSRAGFTWKIPNRRYDSTEMYLPSRRSAGRLTNIVFYLDASGSMSKKQLNRFNSELRYVWDNYQPEKLTIVVFDTVIQQEIVIQDGDYPPSLEVKARGGTCLVCVREHIEKTKPAVAIILSDLHVAPMEKTDVCPVLWICADNPSGTADFGKLFHVNTEKDI